MFYLKEESHVDKYFSTDYLKHHLQSVECSWQFDPSKQPNLDLLIFSGLLNSWWDVWSTTPKIERIDTKHVMPWKMYGLWLFWGETAPENPENPPWTIHLHDSWVPNVNFPGCNASRLFFGFPQCLEKKKHQNQGLQEWWKSSDGSVGVLVPEICSRMPWTIGRMIFLGRCEVQSHKYDLRLAVEDKKRCKVFFPASSQRVLFES